MVEKVDVGYPAVARKRSNNRLSGMAFWLSGEDKKRLTISREASSSGR
ncbi:hypothetical protein A8U91_04095 [Halomonas elongata]|uniref:Uncharacterized protein n=1 Tax=Halomonas elongata TaxID=2746 RepID=A0A1B8NYH4_HALEL|nr:hypothetical protein A8U91_04095 [Halomonas elongata]